MTNLERLIEDQESEVESVREDLLLNINSVCSILEVLKDRLNGKMSEDGINSLGEIQTLGTQIDRGCALFNAHKKVVKQLKNIK